MEQRVSLITLGVADLARSRRFYEALGWKAAAYGNESVTFFQAGGMILALWGRKDLAADAKIADDGSGFRGMSLAYNSRSKDEVDTILAEAERAGARILKRGEAAFWGGYTAYFADPDGHCGRSPGIRTSRSTPTAPSACRASHAGTAPGRLSSTTKDASVRIVVSGRRTVLTARRSAVQRA